jgi:uncharacterized hydrophobic protein (TIGR00271 family)
MQGFQISPERFKVVYQDISEGSEPALRFYLLVAVSTLIAAFGLISDSTAVVIGAMLVAPLMTPIFGVALALVRAETGLLGRALRAEVAGVTAAVAMSFVLGTFLVDFEPTAEILSRTRPTLLDLLVAVLAGFAGAYALVDPKLSPALPGVAIATAIVPPLAASGLCLALGEPAAALGSFLLFFTNFLSILVVASLTFVLAGMARRSGAEGGGRDLARRFRLPVIGFFVIAVFLAHSLVTIARERRLTTGIHQALLHETSQLPATVLLEVHHDLEEEEEGHVSVVAGVSTPSVLTPTQVSRMQDRLTRQIGMPTELVVHCLLSSTVSARGSVNATLAQNLDGTFTTSGGNDTLSAIATTEQILREHLAEDRTLELTRVELVPFGARRLMVAQVVGIRRLTRDETAELEAEIRQATGDEALELVAVSQEQAISTSEGASRHGWFLGSPATPETRELLRRVRGDLRRLFEGDDRFELLEVNTARLDDRLHVWLEVAGPQVYSPQGVDRLREWLVGELSEPVDLYLWSRVEVVHGPEGVTTMKRLNRHFTNLLRKNLPPEMPLILEAARE